MDESIIRSVALFFYLNLFDAKQAHSARSARSRVQRYEFKRARRFDFTHDENFAARAHDEILFSVQFVGRVHFTERFETRRVGGI